MWTSVSQVRVSTVERALISSVDTVARARTVTPAPTVHDVRTVGLHVLPSRALSYSYTVTSGLRTSNFNKLT